MECIQSESRLVEQYRNVVEDFRRDLKVTSLFLFLFLNVTVYCLKLFYKNNF